MKTKKHKPFLATHPGELIKDELAARNLTQTQLAELISVKLPNLNDVIKGKRSVSAELAVLLEFALDIPATYWLNLQSQYDIDIANLNSTIIQKKKICKTRLVRFQNLDKPTSKLRKIKNYA
jgi:HTH-type transcriptional regulator/antitoxin HigA